MPSSIDWRVGPTGEERLATETRPTVLPQKRVGWPWKLLLAGFYGAALLGAAAFGFQVGRIQDARDANLAGIENQLRIETVAWSSGDRELFESTLDPSAAATAELLEEFSASGPAELRYEVLGIEYTPPDLAHVRVRVVWGAAGTGSTRDETRTYRRLGRSWLRSDPR